MTTSARSARTLLRLVPLLLLLGMVRAPGGCVDFDGQSVVVRVDVPNDRLDALIVYRDLHSTDADPAAAVGQLETLRDGARWFALLDNWPWMVNVDSLRGTAEADEPAYARLLEALDAGVEVRPGPLWLDEQGRLCGSQLVRLRGLSDVLARANAALREGLSEPSDRASFYGPFGDEESRALLAAAVENGHEFLTRRGAALAFTVPLSDAGFAAATREALRHVAADVAEAWDKQDSEAQRDLDRAVSLLATNAWALERTAGRVTFVFGDPEAPRWSIEAPSVGGKRHETLLPALRGAGWTILGPEQEAAAREGFEGFVRER